MTRNKCPNCGGMGEITETDATDQLILKPCPVCVDSAIAAEVNAMWDEYEALGIGS